MFFSLFCLQVEFVDMHYGSELDPMKNPFLFAEHLDEIKNCQKVSRGCFFLVCTHNLYYLKRHRDFFVSAKLDSF